MKYYGLLILFRLSLYLEARIVHLRDWFQREKMKCVRGEAPGRGW
jgi:hypothetical protein